MAEANLNHDEEVKTIPPNGSEAEDTFADLFKEEEAPEGETLEQKVARMEKETEAMKKGVSKFFSDKGRKEKAEVKVEKKETVNQSSDDVTELFLESKPEASLVKDDLKTIADAKYNGSIVKAWKEETWLHEKAKALSEQEVNKGKITPPSSETATVTNMEAVSKMSDDEQAKAIKNMSDKDYAKWKEYLRKNSGNNSGVLTI